MQIDLRTVTIKPLRQTFDHVAAEIGGDKPASRYQEATIRVQAQGNFHYRPLWDPDHEIFDPSRTALKMKNWYAFKDPRQYYYGTYTIARARMQETAQADFDFVEERGLAEAYPAAAKKLALEVLLPLRHVAWGSNMNNSFICAYGYGTAITQPCLYQAMDQLGIAQYLTRLGLLVADPAALEGAKQAWLAEPRWQALRRYVEDTFVLTDWFELFVAQNVCLDGLLYPLVYKQVDKALNTLAGPSISMLLRFQNEWFAETSRWVDASVKTATSESPANQQLTSGWYKSWRDRAAKALEPLAAHALGAGGAATLAGLVKELDARATKLGLST
jgi:phenol/toluene 2-monooxygenase (NADH) P1/A1